MGDLDDIEESIRILESRGFRPDDPSYQNVVGALKKRRDELRPRPSVAPAPPSVLDEFDRVQAMRRRQQDAEAEARQALSVPFPKDVTRYEDSGIAGGGRQAVDPDLPSAIREYDLLVAQRKAREPKPPEPTEYEKHLANRPPFAATVAGAFGNSPKVLGAIESGLEVAARPDLAIGNAVKGVIGGVGRAVGSLPKEHFPWAEGAGQAAEVVAPALSDAIHAKDRIVQQVPQGMESIVQAMPNSTPGVVKDTMRGVGQLGGMAADIALTGGPHAILGAFDAVRAARPKPRPKPVSDSPFVGHVAREEPNPLPPPPQFTPQEQARVVAGMQRGIPSAETVAAILREREMTRPIRPGPTEPAPWGDLDLTPEQATWPEDTAARAAFNERMTSGRMELPPIGELDSLQTPEMGQMGGIEGPIGPLDSMDLTHGRLGGMERMGDPDVPPPSAPPTPPPPPTRPMDPTNPMDHALKVAADSGNVALEQSLRDRMAQAGEVLPEASPGLMAQTDPLADPVMAVEPGADMRADGPLRLTDIERTEAGKLLAELNQNNYQRTFVPDESAASNARPYKLQILSRNPQWYSELFERYPHVKRQRLVRALERAAKGEDAGGGYAGIVEDLLRRKLDPSREEAWDAYKRGTWSTQAGRALHGGPLGQLIEGTRAGVKVAVQATKWGLDKAGLLYEGPLQNYKLTPKDAKPGAEYNYTIADAMLEVATANGALEPIAKMRISGMLDGVAPFHKPYIEKYLDGLDIRRRLSEGQQQSKTYGEVSADIEQARSIVPPEILAKAEAAYKAANKDLGQKIVTMKRASADAIKDDYVHHIVREYVVNEIWGGVMPQGVRETTTTASKKAKGSTKAIVEDPYRSFYQNFIEINRAWNLHEFAERVQKEHGQNAKIRESFLATGEFPEDVALYSFGPGKAEVLAGSKAKEIVAAATRGEGIADRIVARTGGPIPRGVSARPMPEDGAFVMNGKKWYAFDLDLAKSLQKAGQRIMEPGSVRAATALAQATRTFTFALRPLSQVKQWLGDPLVAMSGVAPHKWPELWARAVVRAQKLAREQVNVRLRGKTSELVEQWWKEGLLQNFFEQHEGTPGAPAFDAPGVLPHRFDSMGAKIGRYANVPGRAYDASKALAATREGVWRTVLADLYEDAGAPREMAVKAANEVMTNYAKRSPTGQWTAPLTQFTKFGFEQALRLTVKAARDPITGKNSLKGMYWGPYPAIGFLALVREVWNRRDPEREKFWEKSVKEKGQPGRGEFTIIGDRLPDDPVTGEKRYEVTSIDSHLGLFMGLFGHAMRATYAGEFGEAAEEAVRYAAGHVPAPIRSLWEVTTGERASDGGRIEPAANDRLTVDERREKNKARGGFNVTPTTQYFLEQNLGVLAQIPRIWNDPEATPQEFKRATYGIPTYVVNERDQAIERKSRNAQKWLLEYRAAWLKADSAAAVKVLEKLIKIGITPKEALTFVKRGNTEKRHDSMPRDQRRARRFRDIPMTSSEEDE